MRPDQSVSREIRCRCGAWRLEDEVCAWCEAGPTRMRTEQLPNGRWRYLVVAEDGSQMGWSQFDYPTQDMAREYGQAFVETTRVGG